MKIIALAMCVVAASALDLDSPTIAASDKWDEWKAKFNKAFDDDAAAFAKFAATDARINAHNAAGDSYTMGHNQFSAMTPDEFVDKVVGRFNMTREGPFDFAAESNNASFADSLDWSTKGAVTPVKNQAQCGGCWAFSTTGAMEGAYQIANNKLISFSEQELVSCENKAHGGADQGCNGGLMDNAFKWIEKNGICTEASYPYVSGSGRTGVCKRTCKAVAKNTGFKDVQTETGLMTAIAIGPVSVAIEADKTAFQSYKAGVIGVKNPNSCGKQLDHGVLLVGYGTASKLPKYPGDHPYWKVKNSWAASWGEKGYVRILRNKDVCGIASGPPSYPTGVGPA